jgi:hypothetical protein
MAKLEEMAKASPMYLWRIPRQFKFLKVECEVMLEGWSSRPRCPGREESYFSSMVILERMRKVF